MQCSSFLQSYGQNVGKDTFVTLAGSGLYLNASVKNQRPVGSECAGSSVCSPGPTPRPGGPEQYTFFFVFERTQTLPALQVRRVVIESNTELSEAPVLKLRALRSAFPQGPGLPSPLEHSMAPTVIIQTHI